MAEPRGQFFTTHPALQTAVLKCLDLPNRIDGWHALEPTAGKGDLVGLLKNQFPKLTIHAVEIDATMPPHQDASIWLQGDFLEVGLPRHSYQVIVTNPPFVKSQGGKNLYIRVLERCFHLLADCGSMVMIVPPSFFTATSAAALIKRMDAQGRFTHISRPKKETLFKGALIDVVVVGYTRNATPLRACRNIDRDITEVYQCTEGSLIFRPPDTRHVRIDAHFHIYVGLVTACDKAFKNQMGNITVMTGLASRARFIMATSPLDLQAIELLKPHKAELLARRIRKFDEANWYEWGALRNYRVMQEREGDECIFVRVRTRDQVIARVDKLGAFNHALIALVPHSGHRIDLKAVEACLNSQEFNAPLRNASGRFSVGQRSMGLCTFPAEYVKHHN